MCLFNLSDGWLRGGGLQKSAGNDEETEFIIAYEYQASRQVVTQRVFRNKTISGPTALLVLPADYQHLTFMKQSRAFSFLDSALNVFFYDIAQYSFHKLISVRLLQIDVIMNVIGSHDRLLIAARNQLTIFEIYGVQMKAKENQTSFYCQEAFRVDSSVVIYSKQLVIQEQLIKISLSNLIFNYEKLSLTFLLEPGQTYENLNLNINQVSKNLIDITVETYHEGAAIEPSQYAKILVAEYLSQRNLEYMVLRYVNISIEPPYFRYFNQISEVWIQNCVVTNLKEQMSVYSQFYLRNVSRIYLLNNVFDSIIFRIDNISLVESIQIENNSVTNRWPQKQYFLYINQMSEEPATRVQILRNRVSNQILLHVQAQAQVYLPPIEIANNSINDSYVIRIWFTELEDREILSMKQLRFQHNSYYYSYIFLNSEYKLLQDIYLLNERFHSSQIFTYYNVGGQSLVRTKIINITIISCQFYACVLFEYFQWMQVDSLVIQSSVINDTQFFYSNFNRNFFKALNARIADSQLWNSSFLDCYSCEEAQISQLEVRGSSLQASHLIEIHQSIDQQFMSIWGLELVANKMDNSMLIRQRGSNNIQVMEIHFRANQVTNFTVVSILDSSAAQQQVMQVLHALSFSENFFSSSQLISCQNAASTLVETFVLYNNSFNIFSENYMDTYLVSSDNIEIRGGLIEKNRIKNQAVFGIDYHNSRERITLSHISVTNNTFYDTLNYLLIDFNLVNFQSNTFIAIHNLTLRNNFLEVNTYMAQYEFLELGNKVFFIGIQDLYNLSLTNLTYTQNLNISICFLNYIENVQLLDVLADNSAPRAPGFSQAPPPLQIDLDSVLQTPLLYLLDVRFSQLQNFQFRNIRIYNQPIILIETSRNIQQSSGRQNDSWLNFTHFSFQQNTVLIDQRVQSLAMIHLVTPLKQVRMKIALSDVRVTNNLLLNQELHTKVAKKVTLLLYAVGFTTEIEADGIYLADNSCDDGCLVFYVQSRSLTLTNSYFNMYQDYVSIFQKPFAHINAADLTLVHNEICEVITQQSQVFSLQMTNPMRSSRVTLSLNHFAKIRSDGVLFGLLYESEQIDLLISENNFTDILGSQGSLFSILSSAQLSNNQWTVLFQHSSILNVASQSGAIFLSNIDNLTCTFQNLTIRFSESFYAHQFYQDYANNTGVLFDLANFRSVTMKDIAVHNFESQQESPLLARLTSFQSLEIDGFALRGAVFHSGFGWQIVDGKTVKMSKLLVAQVTFEAESLCTLSAAAAFSFQLTDSQMQGVWQRESGRPLSLVKVTNATVDIRNLTVADSNISWSQVYAEVADCQNFSLHDSAFQHNTARMASGGAVQVVTSQASSARDSWHRVGAPARAATCQQEIAIRGSVFEDNFAAGSGGALFIRPQSNQSALISDNQFLWNRAADSGGALYVQGFMSATQLLNNTFSNNRDRNNMQYTSTPQKILYSLFVGAGSHTPYVFDNFKPGDQLQRFLFKLIDNFGQEIQLQESQTLDFKLKIDAGLYPGHDLSGNTIPSIVNNSFVYENILLYGPPTTDFISLKIHPGNQYLAVVLPDTGFIEILVRLRKCQPGEIVNLVGSAIKFCSLCKAGSYQLLEPHEPDLITQCKSCPDHTICLGGTQLYLQPGFWRKDAQSDEILSCNPKKKCRGGLATGNDLCDRRYIGPQCLECNLSNGFIRQVNNLCFDCKQLWRWFLQLFFCALVLGVYFHISVDASVSLSKQSLAGKLNDKVRNQSIAGFTVKQCTHYFLLLSNFYSLDNIIKSFSYDLQYLPFSSLISCLVYQMKLEQNSVYIFVAIILVAALALAGTYLVRRRHTVVMRWHLATLSACLFYAFAQEIAASQLQSIICIKISPVQYYLSGNLIKDCHTSYLFRANLPLALPVLILLNAGLPLWTYFKLRQRSKSKTMPLKYSYLTREYKPRFYYCKLLPSPLASAAPGHLLPRGHSLLVLWAASFISFFLGGGQPVFCKEGGAVASPA